MISVANTSTVSPMLFESSYGFKSSSIQSQSKPTAKSLIESDLIKVQQNPRRFEITIPDFDYKFNFEIIDTTCDIGSEIVFYLKFNENVIKAVLSGELQPNKGLSINKFGFSDEVQGKTPISAFRLRTLWVMISLSKEIRIRIPSLNQGDTMSFDINLNKISEMLKFRQIAYRLMVIEKTFDIRLPFREFIASEYVESIAYCFHSIVDRKFDWHRNAKAQIGSVQTYYEKKEIFGKIINLGQQKITVSRYGVAEIESITTPALPKNAFSKDIQKLIDLESKLIDAMFEKHVNSYSNAFEGLSDEQIEVLTERPILEEEAFNF
jgi:hypothetical protein